jgi:uncharacterized surface protein with fasciclin (FAS1) repeats
MYRTIGGLLLVAVCMFLGSGPVTAQKAATDIYTKVKSFGICTKFAKIMDVSGAAKLYQTAKNPITLFVPTNDAFDKLKDGELDAIMADKVKLTRLMFYHAVEGQSLRSDDLTARSKISNILARPLMITKDKEGDILIGTSKITNPDIPATNGVVHLIDTLLWPPPKVDPKAAEKDKDKDKDKNP